MYMCMCLYIVTMAVRWSRPLKLRISLNTKANMLGKLVSWIQACAALEILQCWLSTSHLSSMNQTREHTNCSASHVCINHNLQLIYG